MAIEFRKKPGIVAYLTAGDPDLATTREIALAAIDNGADVIELGVPFSDPLADGPVIQRASERAVARGNAADAMCWDWQGVAAARPAAGLVLFSLSESGGADGDEGVCAAAKEAGADGVLLTDMIVEEAGEYLAEMRANELAPVFLAAPTSPDARLKAIAEGRRGLCMRSRGWGLRGPAEGRGRCAGAGARLRQFTSCRLRWDLGFRTRSMCGRSASLRMRR